MIVTITHGPTLTQCVGAATTTTDDGVSVTSIIAAAGEQAMNDMLKHLEQVGG